MIGRYDLIFAKDCLDAAAYHHVRFDGENNRENNPTASPRS